MILSYLIYLILQIKVVIRNAWVSIRERQQEPSLFIRQDPRLEESLLWPTISIDAARVEEEACISGVATKLRGQTLVFSARKHRFKVNFHSTKWSWQDVFSLQKKIGQKNLGPDNLAKSPPDSNHFLQRTDVLLVRKDPMPLPLDKLKLELRSQLAVSMALSEGWKDLFSKTDSHSRWRTLSPFQHDPPRGIKCLVKDCSVTLFPCWSTDWMCPWIGRDQ